MAKPSPIARSCQSGFALDFPILRDDAFGAATDHDLRIEFEPALVLAVAALTTTGPLAEVGAQQPIAFADLSDAVKAVLGLAMIVGRLETLALLALILPGRNRS